MIVIDTETTGWEEGDQVIELAVVGGGVVLWDQLIRPTVPIAPQARAVHHIRDEELLNMPEAAALFPYVQATFDANPIVAAHNAEFDVRMLTQTWPDLRLPPAICTWRCSRHIWPEAPSHSNQGLRYWLGLNIDPPGLPHRAAYDALVTWAIVQKMGREVSELVELTGQPVVLRECSFGKHRGLPWAEVPRSYLSWMLGQDFDEDTMHTARYHLGLV